MESALPSMPNSKMENVSDELVQLLKEVETVTPFLPDASLYREHPVSKVPFGSNFQSQQAISRNYTIKNFEDLDSSDDEDVKKFLDRKYNEYGQDINKKIKQNAQEKIDAIVTNEVNKTQWILPNESFQKTTTEHLSKSFLVQKSTESKLSVPNLIKSRGIYTDPVFGFRLINPLISSSVMIERMVGRTPVPINAIQFHAQRGDLSKDWVVAGVIISKSSIKTSKNGSLFSIWKLTDLKDDIRTISLFLFENAHKDLWKTCKGIVVAVLNPRIFDKHKDTSDFACLSVDNPQKVMILGQSKDLGICKAKKKDGNLCESVVNLNYCKFCTFHVKQEFGKMSKRSDIQSATAGRGLTESRNKVLGKNEVFYGGQSYTTIPARKSAKQTEQDQNRLMKLSEKYQLSNNATVNHISHLMSNENIYVIKKLHPISKVADRIESTSQERLQDIERLRTLKSELKLKSNEVLEPMAFQDRQFSVTSQTPTLRQGPFLMNVDISSTKAEFLKYRAMTILNKKPLEKSDPNLVKYRGSVAGKKRAIDKLNSSFESEIKKSKIDTDEDRRKTRIEKILSATSSHSNLVQVRDAKEREKYFNRLETKETLEEKMLNTFKVPCNAIMCQLCKYTAFSPADRCKKERHNLKIIKAEKRFFKCQDCGNRTTTVHKLPLFSCKKCTSSRWKKAPMVAEKKSQDPSDVLSIRGDEEKFLGGINVASNINLVVPE